MLKLLIVDDEEIEREGMANFIDWQKHKIECVGAACNGEEGCRMIETLRPNVVLADINMPVMNGLTMIQKVKQFFPDVVFVILSGYGEFEYTSQAMKLGIRHYILKPCDENKIMRVLADVKAEIALGKKEIRYKEDMEQTVSRMLPLAREKIMRDMLLNRAQEQHSLQLVNEVNGDNRTVFLLVLSSQNGFDHLEQLAINNMMLDLVDTAMILCNTSVGHQVVLLIDAAVAPFIADAVARLREEFKRFQTQSFSAACSGKASIGQIHTLYQETCNLLNARLLEGQQILLQCEKMNDMQSQAQVLFDYASIRSAIRFRYIAVECYLAIAKMNVLKFTMKQKNETASWALRFLFGDACQVPSDCIKTDAKLLLFTAEQILQEKGLCPNRAKMQDMEHKIMREFFSNLNNPRLNIQYLAKEKLFMNTDYLSRRIQKITGVKFSAYLTNIRISLAQRLFAFDFTLKISTVAELVGFAPDDPYFSKVFRKVTGVSPREHCDALRAQCGRQ